MSQFGLQKVIGVSQVLMKADDNAKCGMLHTAVLDLDKAYGKVDRNILLTVFTEWLDGKIIMMARAIIGPLRVR